MNLKTLDSWDLFRFILALPAGSNRTYEENEPTMRVLIIDDEPSIRNTLRIFLVKEGYEVDTTETAMEAFRLVESQAYDILLSDIIMPRISGVEFLDQFRKT